ncbi:hypothetical protein DRN98_04725, partial [Methanosarcinales archaeon]
HGDPLHNAIVISKGLGGPEHSVSDHHPGRHEPPEHVKQICGVAAHQGAGKGQGAFCCASKVCKGLALGRRSTLE